MKKKLKFIAIFNSKAGNGKNRKLINSVVELVKKNHEIEVFETQSKIEAKLIFKKISEKNFDRLVVIGGDGSMFFTINEMINNSMDDKPIAYIPAGTANILKFETQVENNTQGIYQVLISDKLERVNLTKINEQYFFLMIGVGFDSQIIDSINKNLKKYLGKFLFAYKIFQNFLFLNNKKINIKINGEEINADWILCTNSKYYAGSFSITNDTNIFKNNIIVYIFKDLTRIKLLQYIWLILVKGDISSSKSIIKKNLENIKISKINKKFLTQVDGENFGYCDELIISKTKKFINLLVP
tara:strand:- start:42 stop:935 length:894 start_codon:yes stop_codon:yes gene_type:complete